MNDLAAAIGIVQLQRLPGFLEHRHDLAARYDAGLRDLAWIAIPEQQQMQSARIFYWIQTAHGQRDALARHLLQHDVYTSFRYWPLHKTSMYRTDQLLPGADRASESTLMLPLHEGVSESDVEFVIDLINDFVPSRAESGDPQG
jgi:aminotransferase